MENRKTMTKKYTGEKLKSCQGKVEPYLPSERLIEAVNLAILLKKPLLVMGEPGCGKTRLAEAVAYDLYEEDYEKYYTEWRIKSTTKAQEGLYRFDALQKLYDAQTKVKSEKLQNTKLGVEGSYFQYGELSEALVKSQKDKPSVLLIDEIDKADIDFPNDLLNEIDKYNFVVKETGEKILAPEEKPLIIITSNQEKELPAAFLRRCLYFYIEFPKPKALEAILKANYDDREYNSLLFNKALYSFLYVRKSSQITDKNVSTSELLDWVNALTAGLKDKDYQAKLDEWLKDWEESGFEEQDTDIMAEKIKTIPFFQTLVKDIHLWKELKRQQGMLE